MRRQGIRALLGFFLLPLIATLASLIAIPYLIRIGGPAGWATVAIGQGVGTTASLVVAFGWQTVGPTEVARLDSAKQPELYWDSVIMRAGLFVASAPLAAILAIGVSNGDYATTAATVAVAFTMQGLGPAWYLTGQSKPFMIAAMETGPRALAQVLAIFLVSISDKLAIYGITLVAAELAIFATSTATLGRRPQASKESTARRILGHVHRQWPLALSALAGAGYTRAAIPIVAIVAYPAVPVFAALDRTQTFARTAVRPMAMYFQSWVVRKGNAAQWERGVRALSVTSALGVAIGTTVAVGLPTAGQLLFTAAIQISWPQSILTGVTVALVAASLGLGLFFLVPLGEVKVFSITSIVGSVAGVPLILLLSSAAGATGAAAAITIIEGTVAALQAGFVWRHRPSTRDCEHVV